MLSIESRFSGTRSSSSIRIPNSSSRKPTSSRTPVESMIPASMRDVEPSSWDGSSPRKKLAARNSRIFCSMSRSCTDRRENLQSRGEKPLFCVAKTATDPRVLRPMLTRGMCGIAGVVGRAGTAFDRSLLLAMAGELHHRGPDGTGLYADGSFGMVNNRLAIVDLAGGDQPLSDERGRYWVMQNGEIYNYVELMDELERLGHRFATTSDTEVIAHAYEEWGVGCLDRFNGDFAIAVWDRQRRELFLARD